jgi:raffinose/stachyose/melibiose transport system permease protein
MSLSVKLPLDGNVGEVNRSNAASRTRSPVGTAGVFTYTILTALVIFALGPIVLFFFSALKTQNELASNPLGQFH